MRWMGEAALLALAVALSAFAAQSGGDEAAARAVLREGTRSLEAGDVERAVRQFERALRLRPDDAQTYMYLARAHGAAGRFEEARQVLAKADIHARGSRKRRYEIELLRGDLYRDEGEHDMAKKAYRQALELRIFNREARRRLRALQALQDSRQAE